MRFTFLAVVLALTQAASAAITPYTIDFTSSPPGGVLPTAGSFTYDSATHTFSNFLVTWNALNLDLTSHANSPLVGTMPVCLGALTGGAATFALLSGACDSPPAGQVTQWTAAAAIAGGPGSLHFQTVDPSCGINDAGCVFFDVGQLAATGAGTRALATGSWSITAVPEPWSVPELLAALLFVLPFAGQGRARRRSVDAAR